MHDDNRSRASQLLNVAVSDHDPPSDLCSGALLLVLAWSLRLIIAYSCSVGRTYVKQGSTESTVTWCGNVFTEHHIHTTPHRCVNRSCPVCSNCRQL